MGILKMSWITKSLAAVAAIALALSAPAARADVTYPTRPPDRGYIADEANLISAADAVTIRAICDKLLTDKRVPLVVCTVNSIAEHGATGSGWTVDRYARNVYDEWGLGSTDFNYGILVLVSKNDRRARIEMGSGWSRDRDAACQSIMSTDMVPRFKQNDYSGGILAAVKQLDALGRVATRLPAASNTTSPSTSATPTPDSSSTPSTSTSTPSASPAPAQSNPAPRPYTPPAPSYGSNSSSHSSGRGILGGLFALPLACLIVPVIAIFIIFRIIRRAIGFGSGFGSGIFGGSRSYGSGMGMGSGLGWGGGGWGGNSGGSGFGSSGSSWGGGGSSGGGGGGGFSGGSFGGGSSGGGGASGSW